MINRFFNNTKIFINYRRQDSSGHAGRMYDDLAEAFGDDNVIKDIEKIQAGEKYADVIDQQIKASNFLLVLIGPSWLDIDANGKRRIDDPEDLVAKEIIIAFDNKIPVIPVLVNGARMPGKNSLPDTIKPLADFNAIELSDSRWKYDIDRLIKRLSDIAGNRFDKKSLLTIIGVIILLSAITYFLVFKKNVQTDDPLTDLPDSTTIQEDATAKESETVTEPAAKKPIDIVGAGFTANAFSQYIPALKFRDWKPQFVVMHHTFTPNFETWHNTTGAARVNMFAKFFGETQGWKSGPHLFIADDSIWVFSELEKPGVHSASWNKISLGIELVGDFSTEQVNPQVEENAVEAVAAIFKKLKLNPSDSTIRLHRENPGSLNKPCPGKNFNKEEFIRKVAAALKRT